MKNFKLLLGATALLSAGALMVNAGELGVTITPKVSMVQDFTVSQTKELSFGVIIGPVANQKVVVDTNGNIATGTDAKVVSASYLAGSVNGAIDRTIHAGEITLSDGYALGIGSMKHGFDLVLPSAIPLTGVDFSENTITCGTVDTLTTSEIDVDTGKFTYGGTFKVDSGMTSEKVVAGLNCSGSAEVTLIYKGVNDMNNW